MIFWAGGGGIYMFDFGGENEEKKNLMEKSHPSHQSFSTFSSDIDI